jgi:hypothetical protein
MDKMKLGGGGRYEKLIGSRKKLGKAKFQSLAAKGRRRAEREKANA